MQPSQGEFKDRGLSERTWSLEEKYFSPPHIGLYSESDQCLWQFLLLSVSVLKCVQVPFLRQMENVFLSVVHNGVHVYGEVVKLKILLGKDWEWLRAFLEHTNFQIMPPIQCFFGSVTWLCRVVRRKVRAGTEAPERHGAEAPTLWHLCATMNSTEICVSRSFCVLCGNTEWSELCPSFLWLP